MALGFGTKVNSPQPQQQAVPAGDNINVSGKDLDVEFGKHILKVDAFKLILREAFAGWMKVEEDIEMKGLGMSKHQTIEKYIVDYSSRMMNEKGSDYLFNSINPLISVAVQTSRLDKWTIYYAWKAKLCTVRMTMIGQYFFPKLRCQQCEYVTENSVNLREHMRIFKHKTYTKTINGYGLDINRFPDVITTLASLHAITYKGEGGFVTKEITENYVSTSSTVAQQMAALQQQGGGGLVNVLLGKNRNGQ